MKKIILLTGLLIGFLSYVSNLTAQTTAIIKGRVIDAATNEVMPFVNVVEIDDRGRFVVGTVADINGNFVIKVKDLNDSIQVSFIGYKKFMFKIDNRTKIDVTLEQESQTLAEVKITASKIGNDGFTQVRDRATAVTRMELKEMKSVMSTTVEEMMQGRMGNVDITSISGDPGSGLNIRIRGTASLNARNQPLIVVNGIPYDASFDESFDFGSADVQKFGNLIDVSPEDIESVEVLKDAASTAVWGSKASNGVIMIKTKRGSKSKPRFEATFKTTVAKEPDQIPMLDAKDYARLMLEEHYNVERTSVSAVTPWTSQEIAFNPLYREYWNFNQNTDWVKEITQDALTNQLDFSVRGGGEKTKYKMSVGYFDEGGTTVGNRLKKLTLNSSLDYDLSSKLQLKTDIMFTRYDQDANYDKGVGNVRSVAYKKMPNMSIYERNDSNETHGEYFIPSSTIQGDAKSSYNPVAFVNLGVNNKLKDNARALFNLKYTILPNLIYNSTITLDIFDSKQNEFLPYGALGFGDTGDGITNHAFNEFQKKSTMFTINQVIFTPKLPKEHNLNFMTQFDTQEEINRRLTVESSKSASPFIQQPVGDKHLESLSSAYSKIRSLGLFVTSNYVYNDKYIFMVGAKGEGTSKFSANSRWGIFPTVSVAWRISNEPFLKNVKAINELKLRSSWGQSGNQPTSQDLYFNKYQSTSDYAYLDMQGVRPMGLELTKLKWETIDQINVGMDFSGFNERFSFQVDVYKKKTLDLYLKNSSIPSSAGYSSMDLNEGEMENRGVEFNMDFSIVKTEDILVDLNFNVSKNQNMVIRLPENFRLEKGNVMNNGEYLIKVEAGVPMGGFYGYKYKGVYPTNADAVVIDELGNQVKNLNGYTFNMRHDLYTFMGGDANYADMNHDGSIDRLDIVYLGQLNPDFIGGGGLKLKYKNVVLNSFFNFKVGQKIINQTRMDTEKMSGHENQSMAVTWRWRRPGDSTDMPRALYGSGYNWLGSDRFVEDGSFMRLKTLSLSYDFNENFCKKIKVRSLKMYTTGYNLFTWTNYSGQDPDVAVPSDPTVLPKDESRTPPSIRIMFGINVEF
jgi:TonB-linked SusC/RagA family outer membrane protein